MAASVLALCAVLAFAAEKAGKQDINVAPAAANLAAYKPRKGAEDVRKDVPEPSAALIGAVGLMLLLRRRR
jgi:hypothetical protein